MRKPNSIKAAKLENSPRLLRVLHFLKLRKALGVTGAEMFTQCGAQNPGTTCSELKANDHPTVCEQERVTDSGAKVFRYWLIEHAPDDVCDRISRRFLARIERNTKLAVDRSLRVE